MWCLAWLLSCYQDWIITEHDFYNYDLVIDTFEQPEDDEFDILWVIDYSCSMRDQQTTVISGLQTVQSSLPDSNWRMAIIPADGQGALLWNAYDLVIDRFSSAKTLTSAFLYPFYYQGEEGFIATWDYVNFNSYRNIWFREELPLLVVFVSDENEQSPTLTYLDFTSWLKDQREQIFLASIVTLNEEDCGDGDSVGTDYIAATNVLNGRVIDICLGWDSAAADVVDYLSLKSTFALSVEPEFDSINVFVDKKKLSVVQWWYHYDTNSIEIPDFEDYGDYGSFVEIVYTAKNSEDALPEYPLTEL